MSAGRAHSAADGEGCNQQRHGCGPADSLCTGALLLLTGLLPPRSSVSRCQHVAYILLGLSRSGTSDAVSICTLEQIMMLLNCRQLVSVHAGDPHERQAGGPSSLQGKARACLSRDVKCKQLKCMHFSLVVLFAAVLVIGGRDDCLYLTFAHGELWHQMFGVLSI